jgi:hypothetical protein
MKLYKPFQFRLRDLFWVTAVVAVLVWVVTDSVASEVVAVVAALASAVASTREKLRELRDYSWREPPSS